MRSMVEFVVHVPENTPPEQPVFLAGDGPALGGWSADGVRLERWDDGTHRAWLAIPPGFRGRFLVTLGRWRDTESDGWGHEISPRELHITHPTTIEAHVRGWGRNSVHYHHDFPSEYLPHRRTISVWLPPGYDFDSHRYYPVLYMHDGQNLFDPDTAFAGNPWWADEVAEREIRPGRVQPLIIVGVANTPDRISEYGPQRGGRTGPGDWSREYGRFLVQEVKPFIDAHYRTLRDRENTGVAGSSMGGLISLHLCKWYPDVFGKCAAMSPSLWWDREHFIQNLHVSTEWLAHCRVWLDMGTREGGSEAGMSSMLDRVRRLGAQLIRRGMRQGEQLHVEEVDGGRHNEGSWGDRFDRVLRFLYPA
jgi:predicted alpha/beta superfamily hydrolase